MSRCIPKLDGGCESLQIGGTRCCYQSLYETRPHRVECVQLTCIVTSLSSTITSLVRKSAPIYIMNLNAQCMLWSYRIASFSIRLGSFGRDHHHPFCVWHIMAERRGRGTHPVTNRGTWDEGEHKQLLLQVFSPMNAPTVALYWLLKRFWTY